MLDHIRTLLPTDRIDNDAAPAEQGGMTVTDTISPASLARATAPTRGMEAQIDHQFGRVLAKLDAMRVSDDPEAVLAAARGHVERLAPCEHEGDAAKPTSVDPARVERPLGLIETAQRTIGVVRRCIVQWRGVA